jgi:UDP-GlcNAc:undecaprenyl-phosphate GlcNAc-1-phosphate transferase
MTFAWKVRLTLGFVLGFLFSYYGTPKFRKAAIAINLVDRPDGKLKTQQEPVPYLGGLSIFLAFLMAVSLAYEFDPQVLALLLSGTVVLLLGLIDDFGVLSPGAKLFGQLVAAFVLIRAGIMIKLVFVPVWLSLPLTVIWLIGVTNAFNLIDIMDGLAGGVAVICCITLFAVNYLNGDPIMAVMTVCLAGSLLGFLRYNFEPARIYLGDAGSLFIGLMIGALAMVGRYTDVSPVGALAPVVILGVPIFDTLFVMYIRYRRGMAVFLGSQDHFALRLRKWRLSIKQTVLLSYLASVLLGLAALAIMNLPMNLALAVFAGIMIILLLLALWLKKIDMTM